LLDSGLKELNLNLSAPIRAIAFGVAMRFIELYPLEVQLVLRSLDFPNVPSPTVGKLQDVSRGLTDGTQR
jgi:hypothetical protein